MLLGGGGLRGSRGGLGGGLREGVDGPERPRLFDLLEGSEVGIPGLPRGHRPPVSGEDQRGAPGGGADPDHGQQAALARGALAETRGRPVGAAPLVVDLRFWDRRIVARGTVKPVAQVREGLGQEEGLGEKTGPLGDRPQGPADRRFANAVVCVKNRDFHDLLPVGRSSALLCPRAKAEQGPRRGHS